MKKAAFYFLLIGLMNFTASPLWACATCFGKSDSAMAQGMNMGILSLLVVIGCVMAGVSSFFVFIAWRGHGTESSEGSLDQD